MSKQFKVIGNAYCGLKRLVLGSEEMRWNRSHKRNRSPNVQNELMSTPAKFAIDCHVEESEVAMVLGELKPNSDRPDMLWFQWPLLPNNTAFVPSRTKCANGR